MKIWFCIICNFFPLWILHAQKSDHLKPRWISVTPEPCNPTYDFIVVRGQGDTPQNAARACFDKLAVNEDLRSSVTAIVNRHKVSEQKQNIDNGVLTEHISNNMTVDVTINGKWLNIAANPVDEYWEYRILGGNKICDCYILYMVSVISLPPDYDHVTLSHYYGIQGFVRSLIPGWGQIYKGSMAKGICILSGEAVCIAGVIVSENLRASYVKKMHEQPKFASAYNSKADNWETGRNICIGAAVALYIYNLVDAVASKGSKRVIVKPRRKISYSIAPAVLKDGYGLAFTYNF